MVMRQDYHIIGGAGSTKAHIDEIRRFAAGCRSAAESIDRAKSHLTAALGELNQTGFLSSGAGMGHIGTFYEARRAALRVLPRTRQDLDDLADAASATARQYLGAEHVVTNLMDVALPTGINLWLEITTKALLPAAPALSAFMRAVDNPLWDITLTEKPNPPTATPVRSMADAVERTGARHGDVDEAAGDDFHIQIDKIVQPDGTVSWQLFLPGMRALGPNHHPIDLPHVVGAVMGGETYATRAIDDVLQKAGVQEGESVMLAGHSAGGMAAAAFVGTEAAKKYNITSLLTAGSPLRMMRQPPSHIQAIHFEHTDDFVVHLDGGPTVPGTNRTIIRAMSRPSPKVDPPGSRQGIVETIGDPHRTGRYEELARLADAGSEPSVAGFKAAMALSSPAAGATVTTREFVLRIVNKPLTSNPQPQRSPQPRPARRTTKPRPVT